MALDPTNALPGTLSIEKGGDERGGGDYPAVDAGRPCTITWEELYGTDGGATTGDVSGVGAADSEVSHADCTLINGLCDIEVEGSQGVRIARITVTGCEALS